MFVLETLLLIALLPLVWRAAIPGSPAPMDNAARALLRKPDMQACIATAIALYIAIGVLEAIWAVYLSDLGASQLFIGVTLSLTALPMILIAPYAGSVAQRRGALLVSTCGLTAALISMISYGYLTSIWWIVLPLVVHCGARPWHATTGIEQLLPLQGLPDDVRAAIGKLRGALGSGVGELQKAATKVDPTLKGTVQSLRSQAFAALDDVEKKVTAAVKSNSAMTLCVAGVKRWNFCVVRS